LWLVSFLASWLLLNYTVSGQEGGVVQQEAFSESDRVQTERWLAAEWAAVRAEQNPVKRQSNTDELLQRIQGLDGQSITWTFPTKPMYDLNSRMTGVMVAAPDDFQSGIVYEVATTDYWGFGTLSYGDKDAVTPHLLFGRDLDAEAYSNLAEGALVKVRGVIRANNAGGINVVGRIIEDPLGKPVPAEDKLVPDSQWSGTFLTADGSDYGLKVTITERSEAGFSGTCRDRTGSFVFPVSGTRTGEKVEFEISQSPGGRESFPFLGTFQGELADFIIMGELAGRRFALFWHDADVAQMSR
jgi:hypothetical protein